MKKLIRKWLLRSGSNFQFLLQGSVYTLTAKIIALASGWILNLIISRHYGANIVGQLALLVSMFSIITLIPLMGMNTSVLRIIPEQIERHSPAAAFSCYINILIIVIVMTTIVSILVAMFPQEIAMGIFKKQNLAPFVSLFSLFLWARVLIAVNEQTLRGLGELKAYSFFTVLPRLTNILMLVTLLQVCLSEYLPIYVHLYVIAVIAVIMAVYTAVVFVRRCRPHSITLNNSARKILVMSLPMFFTGAMQTTMSQVDVLMLGWAKDTSTVGIYSVSSRLALVVSFIIISINTFLAPKFSALFFSGKHAELRQLARQSTQFIFWTTVPVLLMLAGTGKFILSLFGAEFSAGYIPMLLLIAGQFVNSMSGSVGYFLDMTGHQRLYRNIILCSLMINVLLNALLIPHYGMTGAACASMISLSLWNLCAIFFIKRKFGFIIAYLPGITRT